MLQGVALSRIAGTRETVFKQSLLFVNDPMVPRGIERPDGEWLGWRCAATGFRLEWVLVESSGMAAFDCSAATDESHGTAENRSSSSKPVWVTLFCTRYTHAQRHTYTGHRDRDTPTWAMAGLGVL